MSDDLRDRLAAALRPFVDKGATWSKEQQAVDAVLAELGPELQRRDELIQSARQDALRHAGHCDEYRATLARVREYAELMTDSVVVPVRGYGVDLVHMLDCDQEHATIAEQDACPGPAGAGSTQDGAQ